jgi:hypothetical protein
MRPQDRSVASSRVIDVSSMHPPGAKSEVAKTGGVFRHVVMPEIYQTSFGQLKTIEPLLHAVAIVCAVASARRRVVSCTQLRLFALSLQRKIARRRVVKRQARGANVP